MWVFEGAIGEVLVDRFGEEWEDGCDEFCDGEEAFKERFECGTCFDFVVFFDFPESLSVVSDVPIGEVFDECFDGECGGSDVGVFESVSAFFDEELELGEDPLVEERAIVEWGWGVGVDPVFEACVVGEEGVGVPERVDEAAADFAQWAVAEIEVDFWVLSSVEPSHGVGACLFCGIVEPYRIARRFMHLLAVFVAHEGMA